MKTAAGTVLVRKADSNLNVDVLKTPPSQTDS